MKGILLCLLAVAVAGLGAAVRADITATQYVGHGITPVDAPSIRMVSAKVDIVWGEPGTLSAVFVMNNEAAEAADVQLGFPVSLPEQFRKKDGLDFTMSFDGVSIDRASIRQDTPAKDDGGVPAATIWFHCRHRFSPGITTVKVDTRLPATAAYHRPYREELTYCVQTGAGWKGRIGSEEIAIHFPHPIRPGEIESSEPAAGTVEGDTVRWRFEDFEPEKGDHDITLSFLHPCVLPILDDLRRQSAKAPHDLRKKLNLIKHLLALCDYRHSYPEPPQTMTREENERILAMLRSDADRARFRELFVLEPDGWYWSQDDDELTTMLSAVGYVPLGARSGFLVEGRELLAQFLKEHPHNADAWNIHLLHFLGDPDQTGVAAFQMEQIKIALQNCPDDPTIRLWNSYGRVSRERQAIPEGTDSKAAVNRLFTRQQQLIKLLKKRGFFAVRFKQRSYGYYME